MSHGNPCIPLGQDSHIGGDRDRLNFRAYLMQMQRVSASIVAFKESPAALTGAIHSVVSSHDRVICTVVDNSPEPSLRETVLEAGGKYVFNGENLGFGAGHNVALKANLGLATYQLVLNPDIRFGPDVLPALCVR